MIEDEMAVVVVLIVKAKRTDFVALEGICSLVHPKAPKRGKLSTVGAICVHVAIIVPEVKCRLIERVLVAGDRERGGAQVQHASFGGWEAEPAGGEDAEEMAVAEEELAAAFGAEAGEEPIGAGADLLDRLAALAAVAKERPVRMLAAGSRLS